MPYSTCLNSHTGRERERNQRQWLQHLLNGCSEIVAILEDSPSLQPYLGNILEQTYQAARREAETLIGRQLPERCPWTLEQVRSDTFYPDPVVAPHKRKAG
jgi:hypothetical protein